MTNKKVVLISSKYLFRDPRYLLFAKTYRQAGYDVICVSLLSKIYDENKSTELYQQFQCYSSINSKISFNKISNNKKQDLLHTTPHSYTNKVLCKLKKLLFKSLSLKAYNKILKLIISLKEQLIRPVYIIIQHYRVRKTINSTQFESIVKDSTHIHGCEFFFGAFAANYAAKKFNKKFIFDAKELHIAMVPEFSLWTKRFIRKNQNILFKNAHIIPCVAEPIIEHYIKEQPEFNTKFIYMPNTQQYTSPLNKNHYKSNTNEKIKFIALANYLPFVRGIEYLIETWDKLAPSNAELYLYLSNLNEISRNYLIKLASNTLSKSLFLMPPVKEDDINKTIFRHDIGIVPYLPNVTLNHLYCCPNKFGQYLSNGLAIMSSDTKNITRQIRNYNLGYIYPTNNINNAVESFRGAINNIEQLTSKQESSCNYFKSTYNWNNYSKKFTELL